MAIFSFNLLDSPRHFGPCFTLRFTYPYPIESRNSPVLTIPGRSLMKACNRHLSVVGTRRVRGEYCCRRVAYAQAQIVGAVRDESGGVLPGRDGRSREPRDYRESAHGRHRRSGTVPHRGAATRHLQTDIFADRLQHGRPREHRRAVGSRHHHQRRHESRRARRNDHRLRRDAAGRRVSRRRARR